MNPSTNQFAEILAHALQIGLILFLMFHLRRKEVRP